MGGNMFCIHYDIIFNEYNPRGLKYVVYYNIAKEYNC